jgi:hypothetical protein
MNVNKLTWVRGRAPGADKSAVAAINRALQFIQAFHPEGCRPGLMLAQQVVQETRAREQPASKVSTPLRR